MNGILLLSYTKALLKSNLMSVPAARHRNLCQLLIWVVSAAALTALAASHVQGARSAILKRADSGQRVEAEGGVLGSAPPELPKPSNVEPASLNVEPASLQETMMRAERLFSADVLADPRSRQAREALPHLAMSDRMIQLCNIEALEQVHMWKADFQPDTLVAHAMADAKLIGRTTAADGGAFRSKRRWYNIRFRCEVAPDLTKVVAFEFQVGEEIPKSEWESHNLTAGD